MLLISLAVSLYNILKVKTLECISAINQKCMSNPKIINLNTDKPVFNPLSIKVNKCGEDCNNINDPMAKLCVPDVVKDMNIKVFNLLARINKTRKVVWHETCKCVCRLTSAICNDRQEWNKNKCTCECKEDLIGKLMCDKGYMWNLSTCSCECDKYCEAGQYLYSKNCVFRKRIISDLIEQCTSIIDMETQNSTEAPASSESSFNTTYIASFIVFFMIFSTVFGGAFYYWRKHSRKVVEKKCTTLFIQTQEG